MRAYNSSASWLKYKALLLEHFSIEMPRDPEECWVSLHDHTIHMDVWTPSSAPLGTVILVHGGGGNGRVLAPFAVWLSTLGWTVMAPDLPGYGLTQPAKSYRGAYGEWPDVITALCERADGPVVLMGLSVGGMTAVLAAQASTTVRGVIATTLLDMSDAETFVKAARWPWLGRASLLGFRLLSWPLGRLALPLWMVAPLKKMTSNPALQHYFSSDPLLGRLWVKLRFFRTLQQSPAARGALGCPLLLVHPGADQWTPSKLSLKAFQDLSGPKTFVELTNGSHLPIESPAFEELKADVGAFLKTIRQA